MNYDPYLWATGCTVPWIRIVLPGDKYPPIGPINGTI